MGQRGSNAVPLMTGFTRVAACAISAATVLGALVGFAVARVIVRGD